MTAKLDEHYMAEALKEAEGEDVGAKVRSALKLLGK